MAIKDTLKKQFLFDSLVVLVIIVAGIVAFWISGKGSVGWEIEKKTENVENEEKTINENIYIHDNGTLEIKSSEMTIDSESNLSIWLEGSARLSIDDSVIKSSKYPYTISSYQKDNESPNISIVDSDIVDHYGIFLKGDSSVIADGSVIGKIVMMENSEAEISDSQLYLVLDSDKKEEYSNISTGKSKNFDLESREGWSIKVENSELTGIQVNIDEDDDVFLDDFSGAKVLFSINRGVSENFLTLPPLSSKNSGKFEEFNTKLSWQDSVFSKFGFVLDDSDLKINKTEVEDIILTDSDFEIVESDVDCSLCNVLDSTLKMNLVSLDDNSVINVYGDSLLEISNSDIRSVEIVLNGKSSLILKNCQYDEGKIQNNGSGDIGIL